MIVSVYKNFSIKLEEKNIIEILSNIKSGEYKSDINSIRYALQKGDKKAADEIKKSLLGFTSSATFGESRKEENLITYSQIVCLDFDHVGIDELPIFIKTINDCKYTLGSFISPSGEGIKVFVKVNSNAKQHKVTYVKVAKHYKNLIDYDFDSQCKDISRLCFVSYDPETYINIDAAVFEVMEEETTIIDPSIPKRINSNSIDSKLIYCLEKTELKEQYIEGNRNNFIYLFASNANRYAITEDYTLDFCISNFDLDEKEIKKTIQSVYRNQIADFAKFADFAEIANLNNKRTFAKVSLEKINTSEPIEENYLLNSPIIPNDSYDNLPPILKQGAEAFSESREKDVFLTGSLAILSGCLPNVIGEYGGRKVYPNLFAFIIAPAASGKGALQSSKELADKYHLETITNSKEQKKEFDNKIEEYKQHQISKNKKSETPLEIPQEPPFKVVYIPANTSNSGLMNHLQNNDGKGIICETEADTMGQAFKNDWGSYSDLLRKAFHHEKISVSRKSNNEYFELNEPQLSVALSGTPSQVNNIISSSEDGLFSRFIFYVFKTESKWIDPSPYSNRVNLTNHFSILSTEVNNMVLFLESNPTIIHLSKEQWDKFNPIFDDYLKQISAFVSDDAQSIVKRLGLVLYRICMIFTAIRKYAAKEIAIDIQCLDLDFELALQLIEVYLKHNILMFENLPRQDQTENGIFKKGQNKKLFFDALPTRFSRKEAIELAHKYNIAERTVGNFLKSCLDKYLVQPEYGFYEKIPGTIP